jgi:fumarylpyruvate hydrolase
MPVSDYVIAPPPRAAIPVRGSSKLFPVRRIYCIGRNYAAHTREMGGDPTRDPPFFFQKASDAVDLVPEGGVLQHPYPPMTSNYHFEIEMAVALSKGGVSIAEPDALNHVFGYAVALDMTRRDLQDEAKRLARPWEVAKSGDRSAPIGALVPASEIGHLSQGAIRLAVDGVMKQNANLADMIWSVPEQIAILSRYYKLEAGDIILSGTPEGVGKVDRGQTMTGSIEGLGEIQVKVV